MQAMDTNWLWCPRTGNSLQRTNYLEEGNACVSEATNIEALTILVCIFHVVDIPDKLGTNSIYTHYLVELAF